MSVPQPLPLAAVRGAIPIRRDAPTYGIPQVRSRLGEDRRSDRWVIDRLRFLHAKAGFPAPLPAAGRGRDRYKLLVGADAIGPHARWDRRAVDAWFDGLLPPGARDAIALAGEAAEAAALDANADNLDALLAARRAG